MNLIDALRTGKKIRIKGSTTYQSPTALFNVNCCLGEWEVEPCVEDEIFNAIVVEMTRCSGTTANNIVDIAERIIKRLKDKKWLK